MTPGLRVLGTGIRCGSKVCRGGSKGPDAARTAATRPGLTALDRTGGCRSAPVEQYRPLAEGEDDRPGVVRTVRANAGPTVVAVTANGERLVGGREFDAGGGAGGERDVLDARPVGATPDDHRHGPGL